MWSCIHSCYSEPVHGQHFGIIARFVIWQGMISNWSVTTKQPRIHEMWRSIRWLFILSMALRPWKANHVDIQLPQGSTKTMCTWLWLQNLRIVEAIGHSYANEEVPTRQWVQKSRVVMFWMDCNIPKEVAMLWNVLAILSNNSLVSLATDLFPELYHNHHIEERSAEEVISPQEEIGKIGVEVEQEQLYLAKSMESGEPISFLVPRMRGKRLDAKERLPKKRMNEYNHATKVTMTSKLAYND